MRPGIYRRRGSLLVPGLLSAIATIGCAAASPTPASSTLAPSRGHASVTNMDGSLERAVVPIQRVSFNRGPASRGSLDERPIERGIMDQATPDSSSQRRRSPELASPERAEVAPPRGHVAPLVAVRATAVCIDPSVEPRQPTCKFNATQSVRGVRLTRNKLKGSLRWCAGEEPMPWVSSTRAAKLNIPYEALGLPNQDRVMRPGTETVLGAVIDHHWAIATVFGQPVLFATTGVAVPLRHSDGSPAHELGHGGVFPPSKGAMLRFPEGSGAIYRIEPDGTVVPISPPSPGAQYVGWASNGGGQDSLWRWASEAGDEVWAVVHHRADGTMAGAPETFASPAFCADLDYDDDTLAPAPRFRLDRVAPDNVRHGGHPGRGIRVAQIGDRLCLDGARGGEDLRYWRSSTDRPGGAERVTCSSWRLDVERQAPLRTSAAESRGRDAGGAMSLR